MCLFGDLCWGNRMLGLYGCEVRVESEYPKCGGMGETWEVLVVRGIGEGVSY